MEGNFSTPPKPGARVSVHGRRYGLGLQRVATVDGRLLRESPEHRYSGGVSATERCRFASELPQRNR